MSASPAAASALDADLQLIASLVTSHSDFPKPGILFRDIFPVFQSPKASRLLLTRLTSLVQQAYSSVDVVVGLDARGFLFGPGMAQDLHAAFVPIRKAGKLPGPCEKDVYDTEYSSAESEIQVGAIKPGQRVVLVDDLLATGGTLASAVRLVRKLGGVVVACVVVMELPICEGRKRLVDEIGIPTENIHALLQY